MARPLQAWAALLLSISCASSSRDENRAAVQAWPVIYGQDDRVEPYEADDELYDLATQSAIAMIPASSIATQNGSVEITVPNLRERDLLCETDRFLDQPAAAVCSGTLVDSQLVLTAGHCLRGNACAAMRFVRGFFYESEGVLHTIRERDVYRCEEIVARELSPIDAEERLDYAWIRLDRPVQGYDSAIEFRDPEDPIEVGESVIFWGFSAGVPLKIAQGGEITDARESTSDYVVLSADTFIGNSGAGIFDEEHKMIAIQARGGDDFMPTEGHCNTSIHRPDEPEAAEEQATYAARALEGLCKAAPETEICCSVGLGCKHAAGCSAAGSASGDTPGTRIFAAMFGLTLGLRLTRPGGRPFRRPNGRKHARGRDHRACRGERGLDRD